MNLALYIYNICCIRNYGDSICFMIRSIRFLRRFNLLDSLDSLCKFSRFAVNEPKSFFITLTTGHRIQEAHLHVEARSHKNFLAARQSVIIIVIQVIHRLSSQNCSQLEEKNQILIFREKVKDLRSVFDKVYIGSCG